ncbi:MAG: S41 family peptidase [Fusobacteriaceae bacterium]
MFKKLKSKIIIVGILVGIFAACFAATSSSQKNEKAQVATQKEVNNNGFLSNIRELKEISDIMGIIFENYVSTKEGQVIDRKTLLQGAIKGMVSSLEDPYTNYFPTTNLQAFKEDLKGQYAGVGMVIQKIPEEYLVVVSPIDGTPASRAGIKPKDKIISINGETTLGITSEDSSKKLKGKAGTKVKIVLYRESDKSTKEVELVREEVKLKYVKGKMLENNIGYIKLTEFGENVYPDVAVELDKLVAQGMKGLVFDLRNNPGGAIDQAVKITSMFVKDGRVVSTKGKKFPEEIAMRTGKYYGDFPLVILINGGSASASEIVSGAIKDYKRGTLVGEKSFGKGSVQTIINLPDGDGIKLTIAKYYTPKGISIHGIGIEPDVKVIEEDAYMLYDGTITNIDEAAQKASKTELIKEVKGDDKAKEFQTKVDYQLDKGIEIISRKLGIKYTAKVPPVKATATPKKETPVKKDNTKK